MFLPTKGIEIWIGPDGGIKNVGGNEVNWGGEGPICGAERDL